LAAWSCASSCVKAQRLPTAIERSAALERVGYKHVSLQGDRVRFDTAGVQLDLGGIAQGYFADEAVRLLRAAGAQRCLVDVSGDIVAWQRSAAQPFRVGIKDPLAKDELLAVVTLDGGGLTTGGNYERYYEIDGQRFCHIFDARTGEPITGMLSVTLLAPTGIEADALDTAVFVLGPQAGARFVEAHPGLEAVIVYEAPTTDGMEHEVYVSPGLRDRISYPQAEHRSPKAGPAQP
jgi:thiamine biosynthesis lipoprotein